jgi:hypothetical protein
MFCRGAMLRVSALHIPWKFTKTQNVQRRKVLRLYVTLVFPYTKTQSIASVRCFLDNTQRIAHALCFVEAQCFASPPCISLGNLQRRKMYKDAKYCVSTLFLFSHVQRRKVLRLYVVLVSVYNTQRIAHALCFVEAQYFASPPCISLGKFTKAQSVQRRTLFPCTIRNGLRMRYVCRGAILCVSALHIPWKIYKGAKCTKTQSIASLR